MDRLIDMFKALSDGTRLRIINLLYEKELCVCDIMEVLRISQAKASRHLIYMKNAGLVKDRRNAQWVYYSIQDGEWKSFIDNLVQECLIRTKAYDNDLENLKAWLVKKDIHCD
jgi:ArsR family transcriptional regulator